MNDDVLQTRTGIRVLADNEVEAVTGANIFALLASGIDLEAFADAWWVDQIGRSIDRVLEGCIAPK